MPQTGWGRELEYENWMTLRPADADLIALAGSYALLTSWWREWQMGDGNLKPVGAVKTADALPVINRLERVQDALRIAQAQQALLGGDVTVGLLYDVLVDPATFPLSLLADNQANRDWWDKNAAEELVGLACSNGLVARNFGLYFAVQRLGNKGALNYEVGWRSRSLYLYEVLDRPKIELINEGEQWTFKASIGAANGQIAYSCAFPLPTPADLREGLFVQTAQFAYLFTLSAQVGRELAVYNFRPSAMASKAEAVAVARHGLLAN
jgi:hypothetical protein